MSNESNDPGTTPARRIPLIPIYGFSFVSALTVSISFRFERSAHAALLGAGVFFAVVAVAWLAWFLVAADELFKTINYWALVFGFVSFLALTLVFEFLRAFGLPLPPLPLFGVPICMLVLWTIGLILAGSWLRSNEGREE
jgi:predicted tellurium resistance membrane protein TerC